MFLGYALYAEKIWKGDIMIADIEELEEMDATNPRQKGRCKRSVNADER